MKKYIIAFGLFCLSLFLIDDVYAYSSSPGWGIGVSRSPYVLAGNCSSSSCSTDIPISFNLRHDVYSYYQNTSGINMSANGTGMMWAYQVPTGFKKNYIYSISTYICHNTTANLVHKGAYVSNGASNVLSKDTAVTIYNNTESTNFNTTPFIDLSFSKCGYSNIIFNSPVDGKYFGYNFTISSSVSSYKSSLIGYDIQVLGSSTGLTSSQVQNIINNSDLAKASSIEEVQQAQEEIKTELQNTQSAIDNQTQQQQEQHKETMDTITDSDSSGATGDAGSFFEGFNTDTFGLTSIITSPLNLIQNITSKTCTPLNLQIPFVDKTMQLPCMSTIYQRHFGSFLTIYQTITFGIISYWVCIRVFALVKDFKNPDHDEIEVMDL